MYLEYGKDFYFENSNLREILSMSGEKLDGDNCIEITKDMIEYPLSEYKKENIFDIKKQILRKKTDRELLKEKNIIEIEKLKKELDNIDFKMIRSVNELLNNIDNKEAKEWNDYYNEQKKIIKEKIDKLSAKD